MTRVSFLMFLVLVIGCDERPESNFVITNSSELAQELKSRNLIDDGELPSKIALFADGDAEITTSRAQILMGSVHSFDGSALGPFTINIAGTDFRFSRLGFNNRVKSERDN